MAIPARSFSRAMRYHEVAFNTGELGFGVVAGFEISSCMGSGLLGAYQSVLIACFAAAALTARPRKVRCEMQAAVMQHAY